MNYDDEYPSGPENDHEITLNAEIQVGWNNDTVIEKVVKRVSQMLYDDIRPTATEAIAAALDDLANKAIAELFDSEVQPTDRWGKPLGSPVSIRETLQRDAEKWLTDVVDHNGRRGRGGYDAQHQRIHWLFQEALNGKEEHRQGATHLHKLVVAAVKDTIGDVEAIVNDTVREQARKALGMK
jgi:hypothetical protein